MTAPALSDRFRLDAVCTDFERVWVAGPRPALDEYLDRVPVELRPALLTELLRCEIDLRRERGETPCQEDYQGRFDEATLRGLFPDAAAPSVPGYEVLAEVGRGGMGVVYKARQLSVSRVVALKVILAGDHASPGAVTRFRAESRAVAALRHPNVVQVFDAGEHDGRPYQVLEYCDGGSLDARLREGPLGAREAARLVRDIAGGVACAHAAGIVHRELKPANVLICRRTSCQLVPPRNGQAGSLSYDEPKVADFGLARRTDQTRLTHSGALVGTPSYMAPEQADGHGDFGPPADVWALGAILYECLTGRPPFKADTVARTLRLVLEAEPAAPRLLAPDLPHDLENVCLKCLEKEPRRRYASAQDLADDLGRLLAGEPVRARPIGAGTRLARWGRRHRGLAALAAALTLSVLAGLTVVVTLWRRSVASERRLRESLSMYTLVANKLFRNVALIGKEERDSLVKAQETYLSALEQERDPDQLHQVAYQTLQLANGLIGVENELAERPTRRARDVLGRLSEQYPDRLNYRFDYSQSCAQLAGTIKGLGQLDEALRLLQEAIEVITELLRRRQSGQFQTSLASYQATLAHEYGERGWPDLAFPLLDASLATQRGLLKRYPNDPNRYDGFRSNLSLYAELQWRRRDLRRCLEALSEGVELAEKVRATHERWQDLLRPSFLDVYAQVAIVRQELGQKDEAIAASRRALALNRERAALLGQNSQARMDVADALHYLANLVWLKDRSEGETAFRQALVETRKLAEDSGGLPACRYHHARWLLNCPAPSVRDDKLALKLARDLVAADPEMATYRATLGATLCVNGQYADAVTELARAIPRLNLPNNPGRAWEVHSYLAVAKWHLGDRPGSQKHLEEAAALKPRLPIALYGNDCDVHHRLCKQITEGTAQGSR